MLLKTIGALSLLLAGVVPAAAQVVRPFGQLVKGQPAPAFRLMDVQGKPVALPDFRGKVVYLDFWGSWCRPCLAEMPAAATLRQQFAGRDVVFVYVSNDVQVDAWKATIAQHGLATLGAVHLLDPQGTYAARPYGVQGYPTYVLLGRDGRVLEANAPRPSDGRRTARMLEAALAVR